MTETTRRVALLAGIGGLVAACANDRVGTRQTPSFYRDLTQPGAIVDAAMAAQMISTYRQNAGLGPVSVDPRLQTVARDMAQAMARAAAVEASLRQPPLRDRLARAGYQPVVADENVSAGYHTLAEAFSGWRGSRPHDRVMRLPNARHLGIATVYVPGSRHRVYWSLVMAATTA